MAFPPPGWFYPCVLVSSILQVLVHYLCCCSLYCQNQCTICAVVDCIATTTSIQVLLLINDCKSICSDSNSSLSALLFTILSVLMHYFVFIHYIASNNALFVLLFTILPVLVQYLFCCLLYGPYQCSVSADVHQVTSTRALYVL